MPAATRFFHPVLPTRRLGRKPRRVVLAGVGYVLFRDGDGRPAALRDRCAHRFARLSSGEVDEHKVSHRFLKPFAPPLGLVQRASTYLELRDDIVLAPAVADTPFDMKGMRLGRFDGPVQHNDHLLKTLYLADAR